MKLPKSMKKVLRWYKLDNSARLYPILITKNSQSLFRISAMLDKEVEPERLAQALNDIMPRFPSFSVRLRNGIFWYYLEENNRPTKVFKDSGILLEPIDTKETNYYWFRVSYFSRKVNFDVFHALCDASGALEFFKALLHRYYILGGLTLGNDHVMDLLVPPTEEEVEDCFQNAYQKTKLKDIDLKKFAGKPPMKMTGTILKGAGYGSVMGTMSCAALKKKANEYGCSINLFLAALLMQAIVRTYGIKPKKSNGKDRQKPIVMMVPVNLRRVFGGSTLRNFVLFTRLTIMPSEDMTLERCIEIISRQFKEDTTKECLQAQLNTTVKSARTPIFKLMPLPLKYILFRFGKLFLKSRQTMIFSNVGRVELPEGIPVDRMFVHLNVSKNSPKNVGAISVGDNLVVSFTRDMVETETERWFFTSIVDMGIPVTVASNFREEQDVL